MKRLDNLPHRHGRGRPSPDLSDEICEIRGCSRHVAFQLLRPPDRRSTGIRVCRPCMQWLVAADSFVYVGAASA